MFLHLCDFDRNSKGDLIMAFDILIVLVEMVHFTLTVMRKVINIDYIYELFYENAIPNK